MSIFIRVGIIILITAVVTKMGDIIFSRLSKNHKIHMKFMKGMVKAVIIVAGILVLGNQFETTKEISSILLQNTALMVAVLGFAAQQTLNDILSGLMISWYKPFDIGVRIHIVSRDITGLVEDITLRHTVIRCFDNTRIIIPNSIINKEILRNSNYEDSVIGNYMEIAISVNCDVRRAIELVDQIIREHPEVITTDTYTPGILVKDITNDGYILKSTIWTKTVDENFNACSDIRIQIREKFREENLEML